MKKLITISFLIMVTALCTSKIVFADSEVSPTPTVVTSDEVVTPTPPAESIDITVDPLYTTLLSKNDTKNNLIEEENNICKDIKEQEESNKVKASAIIEKSKSYSKAYNKIIDDIKLLLNPVRAKRDLAKSKTGTNAANSESAFYNSQLSNLNLAVKAMRESIKYISQESIEYHQKLKNAQKNIDKINLSIEALNKEIIADKASKENEWNSFCQAIYKADLVTANERFDNLIKVKEQIIKNYNEILKFKKGIEEQLMSVENS